MFKRIMLALTFIGAFSVVGVGFADNAEASRWGRGWGGPAVRYYAPPRVYYYDSFVPYRSYYYGPRYRTYYGPRYYGYPDYYYYQYPRSGVSFSIGF